MKKIIFLYSGEGTKNSESNFKLLKHSRYWSEIEHILNSKLNLDLEEIWNKEIDYITYYVTDKVVNIINNYAESNNRLEHLK